MRAAGGGILSHVLIDARLVECRGLPDGAVAVPMTDGLTRRGSTGSLTALSGGVRALVDTHTRLIAQLDPSILLR
jgi:hypothetical protein